MSLNSAPFGFTVWLCDIDTEFSDLERCVNAFGSKCLPMIVGYCWNDFVS